MNNLVLFKNTGIKQSMIRCTSTSN